MARFLHVQNGKKNNQKSLSFTRLFLCDTLPLEWRIHVKATLAFNLQISQLDTV